MKKKIKIVHISSSDGGGAGKAAFRLNEALNRYGVDSKLLCRHKTSNSNDVFVFQPTLWEKFQSFLILRLKTYPITKFIFKRIFGLVTCSESLHDLSTHPLIQEADIVNLHWVGEMFDYKKFFKNVKKPIVWTLHDMSPFMGRIPFLIYKSDLKDKSDIDYEEELRKKKMDFIKQHNKMFIVNLCTWMKSYSSNSETFRLTPQIIIRNSLDTHIFRPYEQIAIRRILGLPEKSNIFMFGCQHHSDARKGLDILIEAIKIRNNSSDLYITVGDQIDLKDNSQLIHFGKVNDERLMAMLYSSSDAFILPSREDNLPNTLLESLCCGTPVISFSNGGMTDVIKNGVNGYIVPSPDAYHLAKTIDRFIERKSDFNRINISKTAHNLFSPEVQAFEYIKFYTKILNNDKSNN